MMNETFNSNNDLYLPNDKQQNEPTLFTLPLANKNFQGFSNQMMAYYKKSDSPYVNVYLPAYLKIIVNGFQSLNILGMQSQLNSELVFSIYMQGFDDLIRKQFISKLTIKFKRNNYQIIKQKNPNHQFQFHQKFIHCKIIKKLKASVNPYVFFSPIQILDLVISLNFKPVVCNAEYGNNTNTLFRFHLNLMGYKIEPNNHNICYSISAKSQIQFGNYRIARKRMTIQYTNNSSPLSLRQLKKNFYSSEGPLQYFLNRNIKQKQKLENIQYAKDQKKNYSNIKKLFLMKQKLAKNPNTDSKKLSLQKKQTKLTLKIIQLQKLSLKSFNFAHFHIPVYKRPVATILTIYIPLLILGVLNLSIFFSEDQLPDRLNNIATLLIAFVGMIEVIRSQVPPNRHLNMTEVLVVLSSINSMLCLLSSLLIINQKKDDNDDAIEQAAYSPYHDPVYITALLLTTVVLISFVCTSIYYAFFRKTNNIQGDQTLVQSIDFQLFWNYNQAADQHFQNLYDQYCKKMNASAEFFLCQYDYFSFSEKQIYCLSSEKYLKQNRYAQLKYSITKQKMDKLSSASAIKFHQNLQFLLNYNQSNSQNLL